MPTHLWVQFSLDNAAPSRYVLGGVRHAGIATGASACQPHDRQRTSPRSFSMEPSQRGQGSIGLRETPPDDLDVALASDGLVHGPDLPRAAAEREPLAHFPHRIESRDESRVQDRDEPGLAIDELRRAERPIRDPHPPCCHGLVGVTVAGERPVRPVQRRLDAAWRCFGFPTDGPVR